MGKEVGKNSGAEVTIKRHSLWGHAVFFVDVTLLVVGLTESILYFAVRETKTVEECLEEPTKEILSEDQQESVTKDVAFAIAIVVGFTFFGVWAVVHFIAYDEFNGRVTDRDAKHRLEVVGFFKNLCLYLIALDIIGILLAHPDMDYCALLMTLLGMLFLVLMNLYMMEAAYKFEVLVKEEQKLLQQEEHQFEVIICEKIETV